MSKKVKIKFTDFECNLLVNSMNEFRNMLFQKVYQLRMSMTCSLKSLSNPKSRRR